MCVAGLLVVVGLLAFVCGRLCGCPGYGVVGVVLGVAVFGWVWPSLCRFPCVALCGWMVWMACVASSSCRMDVTPRFQSAFHHVCMRFSLMRFSHMRCIAFSPYVLCCVSPTCVALRFPLMCCVAFLPHAFLPHTLRCVSPPYLSPPCFVLRPCLLRPIMRFSSPFAYVIGNSLHDQGCLAHNRVGAYQDEDRERERGGALLMYQAIRN